jgi:FKBP-type peptidyl-prolyl cis-trans isomerase SlyD
MEKIEPDCIVTMKHTMKTRLADGTVKGGPEETTRFIYGVESQVPTIEKALEGASAGDTFHLHIPPAELYGVHDPELVREIPRGGLIAQRLREGQYYRQMKKGGLVSFKVLELRPKTVLADFNEPMAGISVDVDIEVVDVRPASREEIEAAYEAKVKRSIGCG